ncbi:MAG: SLATT domain-containing protein [Flavipsychrobacter sp.]|nr:SLATT domain-containing protein [Flavipsychrobacter sp.]
MEQDSQVKIIESQLRELYGRVVWSHKTQEKCADIILKRHMRLKIVQIALSALTTTGILVSVFGDNEIIGIISAILSAILFGLNTYTKDYDLGEIAQKHSNAASELWNIRESYLSLLADLKSGRLGLDAVILKRDELQENLFNTYKGAPRTINAAYKEATRGLKSNEELTFSNEEIDNLLPKELRIDY